MLRIVNKDELRNEPLLLDELKKSVFIYPTDTVYGIGCDATNDVLVARLREIKNSFDQPFSVVIPNRNLVQSNCHFDETARRWLDRLPAPYTLIMKFKKRFFSENVSLQKESIGVRIPNHWFFEYVKKMGVPIVSTTANVRGEDFMTCLDDLDPKIKSKVDYIVYDGPLTGSCSTIVHLDGPEVELRIRN